MFLSIFVALNPKWVPCLKIHELLPIVSMILLIEIPEHNQLVVDIEYHQYDFDEGLCK